MRKINKIASVFCAAALGLLAMTSCEGGEIFSVNGPDWMNDKIDSIANSNADVAPTISPTTLGAEDNSDAWWTSHLDQDVQIKSKKVYTTTFTNYSSGANNYNNYVIVLRKSDKTEYAVLRSDNYGWGDNYSSCTPSTTVTDWAAWLSEMNGAKVTVTITNYGDGNCDVVADVIGTNGTKSTQKYLGIPVEADNLYLDFTTDGCHYVFDKDEMDVTDAVDQQPASMELVDVPAEIDKGSKLTDLTSGIKAQVTFADGAVKEVEAGDLTFMVVPSIGTGDDAQFDEVGERYVVATYGKTLLGKTADKTINASAKFNVVAGIKSITVTQAPTHTNYYFYNSAALDGVERTLAFDPTGMEVTAKYVEGADAVIDNSKLTFSAVPAKAGKHEVTITTENGRKATVEVNVAESATATLTMSPTNLGADDNSTLWASPVYTDFQKIPTGKTAVVTFTNYSNLVGNWNNFLAVLRSGTADQTVLRADNYGWGAGYDASTKSGGQSDWAAWLAAMNGAKVTAYITNCGNGTVDAQFIMVGTDGNTYNQYYLGLNNFDPADVNLGFSVDGSHLKFDSAASARKHHSRR